MQERARNHFASVRMSMAENISARQQTSFKSANHTLSAVNAQMIREHLLFGCTLAVVCCERFRNECFNFHCQEEGLKVAPNKHRLTIA